MLWRDDVGKIQIKNEDGEGLELADILPSPVNVENEVFRSMLQEQVRAEIERLLSPRECLVMQMRLGINTGIPMTLDAVGKQFGVTRERIRQIETKAIRKLRHSKILKELYNDRPED